MTLDNKQELVVVTTTLKQSSGVTKSMDYVTEAEIQEESIKIDGDSPSVSIQLAPIAVDRSLTPRETGLGLTTIKSFLTTETPLYMSSALMIALGSIDRFVGGLSECDLIPEGISDI